MLNCLLKALFKPKGDQEEEKEQPHLTSTDKIYEETAETYRFLAKWRQLAFAGYLAVLAAGMTFLNSAIEHKYPHMIVGACFLLVFFLGLIFWLADQRTRRLAKHAIEACRKLERNNRGFFSENILQDKNVPPRLRSHSFAASLLFLGSAVLFGCAGVIAITSGLPTMSSESFPADKTLIIPEGTGARIALECSTNLTHWTEVCSATHTNSPFQQILPH